MRQQITHHQLLRQQRVFKLQLGNVPGDRIVERKFLFIDQHQDTGNHHRLGGRGNGEQGVLIHGLAVVNGRLAKALLEHDLILRDHGDRHTRHVPEFHTALGKCREARGVRVVKCTGQGRHNGQPGEKQELF